MIKSSNKAYLGGKTMHKKFFKRSLQIKSIIAILAILGIGFIIAIVRPAERHKMETTIALIILYVICCIIMCLIKYFVAPDFEYWIREEGGYIIFEKSATDHRPILRKYTIIQRTYKKIVLGDERGTIISLAYNAEVLEFLKQLRIE